MIGLYRRRRLDETPIVEQYKSNEENRRYLVSHAGSEIGLTGTRCCISSPSVDLFPRCESGELPYHVHMFMPQRMPFFELYCTEVNYVQFSSPYGYEHPSSKLPLWFSDPRSKLAQWSASIGILRSMSLFQSFVLSFIRVCDGNRKMPISRDATPKKI